MSFIAIGIGMLRDSGTVMVGQYFKKKRCFVEMLLVGSSGLGISLSSPVLLSIIRYVLLRLLTYNIVYNYV